MAPPRLARRSLSERRRVGLSPSSNGHRCIRAFDGEGIPFAVREGGRTGIGRDYSSSAMLSVAGEVEASRYLLYSDARLKEDVRPVGDVLPELMRLAPVLFRWRDTREPGDRTGLIAQQVEEVFPGLVETDEEGLRTVDYDALLVLMLKGMQELAERVEGGG